MPASQTRRAYSSPSILTLTQRNRNLNCIEVDLLGGLKLFIHFARKTRRNLSRTASSTPFNPKDGHHCLHGRAVSFLH
jgi:hypothetical protein